MPSLQHEDPSAFLTPAFGAALADCWAESASWQHRKVESLRLMEGRSGRRRVSIDCTPRMHADLAYEPTHRRRFRRGDRGQTVVPLALIGKNTLRDFDVSLDGDRPLPVLGRYENGLAALSALASEIVGAAAFNRSEALQALSAIVFEDSAVAVPLAEELLDSGSISGVAITTPESISQFGARLAADLAENFMLIALIDDADVRGRHVVKYSFHWQIKPELTLSSIWNRVLLICGLSSVPLELELSGPESAASYHLEVHVPPGLLSAGLALPGGGTADQTEDVVAHAHGRFAARPDSAALLQMIIPNGGMRTLTILVLAFTVGVTGLALGLPGAKSALLDASDGAAALLLAVPAVVVAFLVRPGENAIASSLLMPYRAIVLSCAVGLVAVGASIVGVLHEPYLSVLWWSVAVASASIFLLLAFVSGIYSSINRKEGG